MVVSQWRKRVVKVNLSKKKKKEKKIEKPNVVVKECSKINKYKEKLSHG